MQPATTTRSVWDIALSLGSLLIVLALVCWAMWIWLKKSQDPARLIFKWILTVPALVGIVADGIYIRKAIEGGGMDIGAAFVGVIGAAIIGLYLAIIWRHELANLIARPFGSLYDGGNEEAPPEAHYSSAIAKRKRGQYQEALGDIRKQMEKFPKDFTGQMLQAEIQAENLSDLPTAAITIQRLVNQPGHAPRNVAYALNTLADWQLKYFTDPDAARETLQQIVQMLPDTEFSLLAEQRIGHLASREYLTEQHEPRRIAIPKGVENVGLLKSSAHLAPIGDDPAARAAQLVAHLEAHPQDGEAREQLAILYADHYQRLDFATDQLNQLINQPNQPTRNVIRWLNLLADLQVRHNCPYETVHETLSQIITRYPNNAAADLARNRLDLLHLAIKAKQSPRSIKLGNYEQNIGLKYGPPGGAH